MHHRSAPETAVLQISFAVTIITTLTYLIWRLTYIIWISKKIIWMVGVPHSHQLCPKVIERDYIESIYTGVVVGQKYVRLWEAALDNLFLSKICFIKSIVNILWTKWLFIVEVLFYIFYREKVYFYISAGFCFQYLNKTLLYKGFPDIYFGQV